MSELDCKVRSAFLALCWEVASPFAFKAIKAVERSDWMWLVSQDISPRGYTSAALYAGDAQVACFFRKYPDFKLGLDLEGDAVRTFFGNEAQCYHSNERLSPLLHDSRHYGERLHQYLVRVRKKVKACLGRAPDPLSLEGSFGPGATFGDRAPLTTVPDKMLSDPLLTPNARTFLHAWDQTSWSRHAASCDGDPDHVPRPERYVRGNRFTTVPKDSRKRRGICIEPSINVFYQLAIGRLMKSRFKRATGIDLFTVSELHKEYAREGSFSGNNATIDLSNASDTVCSNLVKLLLPTDWYNILVSLRSPFSFIKGKWVKLEKFSSMGNGFTFELETIIFYCLAKVVCERPTTGTGFEGDHVSVFGDDIIVPAVSGPDVIAALKFFGFTPNKGKTFLEGRFRESCGGDFFDGIAVRPHYLKENPREPQHYIALANGIRRSARELAPDTYRIPWLRVLDALPRQLRYLYGPDQLGDIVIHTDESLWRTRTRYSVRYFRCYRPVRCGYIGWINFRPGVVFASALYGTGDGSIVFVDGNVRRKTPGGVLPKEAVAGHKLGWVAFS